MSNKHEMVLTGYLESGAEEWSCPVCGRRMLLRWPPRFERLVLEDGDITATHVGGKGGVQVTGLMVAPAPAEDVAAHGDVPAAERQWLHDNGIAWDGTTG